MSLSVLNSGGGGGSRVTLDGERVKELAMTSYKGANPYTMGQDGMTIEANTLIKNALQIVNGVSGEDLTETASSQTAAVNALLTMVKRKVAENNGEGQFVWKKMIAKPTIQIASVTKNSSGDYIMQLVCDTYDLSQVDSSFFVGYTGTSDYATVEFSATRITAQLGYRDYTWDASTQQITIPTPSALFSTTGWTTLTNDAKNFVNYVISSDSEAYPDGAELDGYWYELVKEVVSGVDFGKVTLTAAATNITVQHNLKVTPSQAILIELGDFTSSTARTRFAIDNGKSELVQSSAGGNPSNTTNEIVLTSTEISFDSYSFTYKYVAGTYLWIATV